MNDEKLLFVKILVILIRYQTALMVKKKKFGYHSHFSPISVIEIGTLTILVIISKFHYNKLHIKIL